MSKDKVPSSKIERASKFLKTGLKVGGNYLKHYGQKALLQDPDPEELEKANANDIFDSFAELKGSALKVAQMLSMDSINFSQSFTSVMQKAQYSVPPMSGPLAVQAFKKSIGTSPDKVFDSFSPEAHKAASMGQVHVAYKDGKKLAVKIQYPGVADSIKSDLNMVKSVAHRILGVSTQEIGPYFDEVEARLLEEADYRLELKNSLEFREECAGLKGIVFPNYYPEYSSNRVISMEWIDGWHMKEFLELNPPKEVLQKCAENIWEFYEFQIHELKKLNADPHPGNFLFRMDGTVGVLDFGCTKRLTPQLYEDYFLMAQPDLFQDKPKAEAILLKLEILRPTDSPERREYLLGLFGRLISHIAMPYHEGTFNFNNDAYYQELTDIGVEISKLRELRGSKDYLFLNRTYFGLYGLFQQLDAQLNTTCKYHDFVRKKADAVV